MKKVVLFLSLVLILVTSCAKTYKSSTFPSTGAKHKVLAIIPFDVSITPHRKENVSIEVLQRQEEEEGFTIQDQLHMRMLRKKDTYNYSVDFLDPRRVNSILDSNKISYQKLKTMSSSELCKLLNVDGILVGSTSRTKPMSDGAAVAVGVITSLMGVGVWGSTNEVDLKLKIYDGKSDEMIWSYENRVQGSVGSTPNSLAEYIARSVSRKFPYNFN